VVSTCQCVGKIQWVCVVVCVMRREYTLRMILAILIQGQVCWCSYRIVCEKERYVNVWPIAVLLFV
jgi:hypothetical protein